MEASSTTSLHILLQGMHSHDVEQILQGCHRIENELLKLGVKAGTNVGLCHDSLKNASQEVALIAQILACRPSLAEIQGGRDNNLPLHMAAQMGNLHLCQTIFEAFPEAVKTPNKKGKLPLHCAARNGHVDVLLFLIEAFPEGAAYPSKKRKLPLHFSVSDGHLRATKVLLEVYPQGVRSPSAKGKLPLHLAARWGHIDVVQLLLSLHPEGAQFLDWEGSLAIHDASLENQEDVVRILMKAFPKGLQVCNIRGELPLLAAIRNNNPALAYKMLQQYPEAGSLILQNLNETDRVPTLPWSGLELCLRAATGMLPTFHPRALGIQESRPADAQLFPDIPYYVDLKGMDHVPPHFVTKVVLKEVPHDQQSIRVLDVHTITKATGKRPIDDSYKDKGTKKRARQEKRTDDLVPDSAHVFLPMHAAIHIQSSYHVLQRVLLQCSEQVSVQDCFGRFPLHLVSARCSRANAPILNFILRAFPSACTARDAYHRLPLHIALLSKADPSAIFSLMEAYPSSAFQLCGTRDGYFNRKPLIMAMASDCDLSVIFFLLRGDPSAVNELDEAGLWEE